MTEQISRRSVKLSEVAPIHFFLIQSNDLSQGGRTQGYLTPHKQEEGWFGSLPSHGGMATREVNWSGSQTTGPRICDRSEEPLPDTILLQPKRFLPVLTAVRMRITSEL